jgi:mannose/fructose-specific phosphotransferase system component IIA
MNNEPLRAVVVAHGALAEGLVSAVERIAGTDAGVIVALSNDGLGPDGIGQAIDQILQGGPGVVFTDLRAGSCGLGARRCCAGRQDRLLVSGVNLPMLLDFVMNRELPLEQLETRLVERGQQAVVAFREQG